MIPVMIGNSLSAEHQQQAERVRPRQIPRRSCYPPISDLTFCSLLISLRNALFAARSVQKKEKEKKKTAALQDAVLSILITWYALGR